jgi:hypothetical protein
MSLRRSTGKEKPGDHSKKDAPLAQLAEQLTLNQWVPGSSPGGCTIGKAASCSRKRRQGAVLFCPPRFGAWSGCGETVRRASGRVSASTDRGNKKGVTAAPGGCSHARAPAISPAPWFWRGSRACSPPARHWRRRELWQTGWPVPAPRPGAPAAASPDQLMLTPAPTVPSPPRP